MSKIRLNIDGREVIGVEGQTILEVAKENGIDIPTLCYDDKVEVYGSCGLCVVEVEGVPKPLRACATKISQGMIVRTNTPRVKASRKIALELLLSNHIGDCKAPCQLACPARTDCQGYVGLIANGQYKEAVKLIKEKLPLPASIGRVCPHPCEDECRRQLVEEPVSIAWLKRFVADVDLNKEPYMPEIKPSTGKKVAIVGGGPAGLSAAYFLAKEGHEVVIYEAMPEAGGMLRYGIPQYRLPKDVLDKEIELITAMGVKIITNTRVGRDISLSYLRENFDATFIAIGAWKSSGIRCKGEDLEGVIGGIDFLRDVAMGKKVTLGERVAVVGGGNTAMDACRTALRLGAKEVVVVYRRTKNEMPAEEVEIIEAEEEGVKFKFLSQPIEIYGENGKVKGIKVQKMKLGEPDASGRRRPEPIPGETETMEVDTVIAAIGQKVNPDGLDDVELTDWNTIKTDETTFRTNLPDVFAGGDAINDGPGIAIEAIGDAQRAAKVICSYLEGRLVPYKEPYYVKKENVTEEDFAHEEKINRPKMPHLSPEERKTNFREIVHGYTEEQARKEAMRCLECGCGDVFECKLIAYANEYDVEPERLKGEILCNDFEDNHPFIERDPNKCILCGLCVRVCEEVMGVTALGLVNRGFETIVKPEFEEPLLKTDCVSCGQCIAACPTGALQEKLHLTKSVPVETEETQSVCAFCSIGCNTRLNTRGDMIIRALPDENSKTDGGLLCSGGRFGFTVLNKEQRIKAPMIKTKDGFKEVSMDEALLYAAKKLRGIQSAGENNVAVFTSPRYTNEENYLAAKIAKEALHTQHLTSFAANHSGGLKQVLGYEASTNTLEELLSTEVILLIGTSLLEKYPVAGIKVRQAVKNGAKLVVINDENVRESEWAHTTLIADNGTKVLKQMLKALIDDGYISGVDKASGFEQLKASIENVDTSEEIKEIAKIYGSAKKAMIVFDDSRMTKDAAALIADMAVVSGHIGAPRSGIIALRSMNNTQGLIDLGIDGDLNDVVSRIKQKDIKAALIFGEDPVGSGNKEIHKALADMEFVVVQDVFMTATAELADVILPAASFAETRGTYTNAERRIQITNKALEPVSGLENWQILQDLGNKLGCSFSYSCVDEITREIGEHIQEYKGIDTQQLEHHEVFWPTSSDNAAGTPVLYTDGFAFPDSKAKLAAAQDGKMLQDGADSDVIQRLMEAKLKEYGIK